MLSSERPERRGKKEKEYTTHTGFDTNYIKMRLQSIAVR